MLWGLLSRPFTAFLTLAGAAFLAPILIPVTAALIKPLVKPVTNLYLDLADEIGEVIAEREKLKDQASVVAEKVVKQPLKGGEALEKAAGSALLEDVAKIL